MEIDLTAATELAAFADVHLDQFFIDYNGFLCQKCTSTSFNVIADPDGNANSLRADNIDPTIPIKSKFDLYFKLKRKS